MANTDMHGREFEHTLSLTTPQMNRLRYLVGVELAAYVKSTRVAEYDGEYPYLLVDRKTHYADDNSPIQPEHVLRAASQEDYDAVVDMRNRLDNIWSHGDELGKVVSE